MASMLHKLKDRHAILLMHLAGELPGEDRVRVERMLADDPSLRSELGALRDLHESVMGHLDGNQADLPSAAGEEAGVRRVLREMRRRQVELIARPQAPAARPARRWPAWSFRLTTAAAAIIVLIGLWGMGVFDRKAEPGKSYVENDALPNTAVAFHPSIFRVPGADPLENAMLDTLEMTESNDEDPLLLML
jgi:anti-sigma factor RsiW